MTADSIEIAISSGTDEQNLEGVGNRNDPRLNSPGPDRTGSRCHSQVGVKQSSSGLDSTISRPSRSGASPLGAGTDGREEHDRHVTKEVKQEGNKGMEVDLADNSRDTEEYDTSRDGVSQGEKHGYVRAHAHVLQFVLDTDVVSRILEDKDALRLVSMRLQDVYESNVHRYLGEDTMRLVSRLVESLTAYFERVRLDACVDRLDREILQENEENRQEVNESMAQFVEHVEENYRIGALEERIHLFESEVVHSCLCSLLPSVFGMMLQRVARMPAGVMAGILVMWARLCGEMLSARMAQMTGTGRCFAMQYEIRGADFQNCGNDSDVRSGSGAAGTDNPMDQGGEDDGVGRVYASHAAYVEQVKLVFDLLTDSLKLVGSMLKQRSDASNQLDSRSYDDHLNLMVFEMERLQPERLTDWVDIEARRAPADQERWGKFHAAVLVDVFGNMDCVTQVLQVGESMAVDVALLKFVRAAMPVLSESKRQIVTHDAIRAVCARYESGFDEDVSSEGIEDQQDRSGFGGFADLVGASTSGQRISGHEVVALLLPALGSMYDIVASMRAASGPLAVTTAVAEAVVSLEERVIWRLFSSKNVSEELLAVTSLIEILEAIEEMEGSPGFRDGHDDELQRIRVHWIRSSDILSEMLKVNLHHAQYVEDMLLLLGALAVQGLVDGRHVEQLWSTIQDEGTFEEIKSNVCQLLGYLATSMPEAVDMELFCRNLQTKCDTQNVEGKYVEEMMLAAAKHDPSLRLMVQMINISLEFCLDGTSNDVPLPNRTKRMLSGDLLLDIARRYLAHSRGARGNEPVVDCMCSVIGTCMERILGDKYEEDGKALEEQRPAAELLQPLRLLLRIVSGVKIPSEALDDIYKVINDGAKLMSNLMVGYEQNLARMSSSDHSTELLRLFNSILRSVLSESNYYVELGKVKKILSWAITPGASAESTAYAWSLLTYLVQGEKGVTGKTARLLLTSFMEQVKLLDEGSWLCLTAYVAASLDFEATLAVADSYVSLIVMTDDNHLLDIWGPLKDYLCGCLLEYCDTDGIASQCSKLLSHVLITDMDMNSSVDNLERVKESVESFKARLLDRPERVMMFLSDILNEYDYREYDEYGREPVSLGNERGTQAAPAMDANSAPSTSGRRCARPLYSCYKDAEVSFKVLLKNLPMSPRPSGLGGQQGVDISCPRNCMIADLRAIISLQASHLVGYMIPRANFDLHCGGKVLTTNLSRVFEWIAEGDEVVAVFNTKASYKTPPQPDFHLSHMLAQDELFFSSLMTLGDQGSYQALHLINRLPISSRMVHTISQICDSSGSAPSDDLGISYMLYSCQLMQSSVKPMTVDGVAGCHVDPPRVQMPPALLLRAMDHLYDKIGMSMGGDLPRTIINLMKWVIDCCLLDDNADGRGCRDLGGDDAAIALKLLHRIIIDTLSIRESNPRILADDVRFVVSGALAAILNFGPDGSFEDGALGLLIENTKAALRFDDPIVRRAGLQTVQALCLKHGLERVLLRDLVSGILLCESQTQLLTFTPPKEHLQLCSWFVGRMSSCLNGEMLNIAETICQRILQCLASRESIDGYSRCLQISLLRVDAACLPSMKPLVLEILDTFLLRAQQRVSSGASSNTSKTSYFTAFQTNKYALDNQEGLYRVLLSSMMLSEDCWRIAHARLHQFFSEAAFPALYNNSALESFRSLGGYGGLLNGGATCYMNATFQQLYMMPRLRRLLLTAPVEEDEQKSSPVFEALRHIFLRLFAGVEEVVDPSCFWKEFKDYDGDPVDVREHQDGYEFFTRLQDAIDEYLKSIGHEKIMRSVLGGSFNQIIEVPDHDGVRSEREEEFYQISVDVRGKKDLIESLESYVAPETLDGPNQWFCESLGHKVDAKKRTLIKNLPESLVFHLKRFEWDYETYQRWKIKDRFEFPMELDMGPYVDETCAGRGGDGNETVKPGQQVYDLSGIVVHSGTAFAGHYYSFAKERATGNWYHFDDDSVTAWDVADIDQECFGGQFQPTRESKMYMRSQSAYMIIYDRRMPLSETKEMMDGMGAASSRHSRAWSKEFDDTCSSIPARRLDELIKANQIEMTKSTAFSNSLARFMSSISEEVESAVRGPQSTRKPKVIAAESSDQLAETPLHNEVFYIPRGQESEMDRALPLAVNQAVALCLEYISRIAVCGPLGRDPALEVLQPLVAACQETSTARCILSQSSMMDDVLAAMASPYKSSRSILREIMGTCVKATIASSECVAFLEKVLDSIKLALETPALFITWRDLLGLLCDVSRCHTCNRVLANYTDVLLSFSDTMFELCRQQTKQDRATDAAVLTSYAVLVCNLLRHHRLCNSGDSGTRDVQIGNPFCIARDRELEVDVSSETVGRLVAIGMDDDALLLFLQFFAWESSTRSAACVEALIDNMRTSQHRRQVPLAVNWLQMEDSRSTERRTTFLRGALGLFDEFEGNGWIAYNVSLAIASVLVTSPFLVSLASLETSEGTDLKKWARKQAGTCLTISRRLGNDLEYRDQWIQGIPASADDGLRALYDPNELLDTIKNTLGLDVADIVDVPENCEIDLVRMSTDDEKENDGDDSVKEIELD